MPAGRDGEAKAGSKAIIKAFYGNKKINKIYRGTKEVWIDAQPPAWSSIAVGTWTTQRTQSRLNLNNFVSGDTPITITHRTGTLPTGVSFSNGVISGRPTTEGSYALTFRATNQAGHADVTFTITVTRGMYLTRSGAVSGGLYTIENYPSDVVGNPSWSCSVTQTWALPDRLGGTSVSASGSCTIRAGNGANSRRITINYPSRPSSISGRPEFTSQGARIQIRVLVTLSTGETITVT